MEEKLPDPPCHKCKANCCTQTNIGYDFAVALQLEEYEDFKDAAITIPNYPKDFKALPYKENGRCVFLTKDNLCGIYDVRPKNCRVFNCISHYDFSGNGKHSTFLRDNPQVIPLIEKYSLDSKPKS